MTHFGLSDYILDFAIEHQLRKLKPSSVVDFGAGSGKNGEIVRRVLGKDCKLIAVEGCGPAAEALTSKGVYDHVSSSLLQDWLDGSNAPYSVAIFGDVIEHLTPREVHRALRACMKKFDHIIIVAPLHDIFQEGATYEDGVYNELEKHKTYITRGFFNRYRPIEQHIKVGDEYTIMNVLIKTKLERKPLKNRVAWNIFHMAMLALQPIRLARPTVDLLKMTLGKHKRILGR